MNCHVCGSADFTIISGVSHCAECLTQIKLTCDEQSENFGSSRKSASVERTQKDKRKLYGSWISIECYNIILFKQVSSLIKLGASPKLKDTVLHIWSKYLQKCEIAFREDYRAQERMPRLGPVPSKRDIEVLYGDKLVPKQNRKRTLSASSAKSERFSSESETMGEESCGIDGNSSDPDASYSSDSTVGKPKYSSHASKLLRKSRSKKRRPTYLKVVFNMTLPKTLSFCYLGLLYTEDTLSLSDLIRFAYEGKIPYVNIIDKLPSSLVLRKSDTQMFLKYVVPDACSVLKMSHEIIQFLKLPKYKEPSIFLAVSRYAKDLNLPDDIKPIIKILHEQYKEYLYEWKHTSLQEDILHDYQALALIIVALKMLFVLDDKFEIEHSEVMKKLNSIKSDHKYFVWTEWRKQASLKEYLFLSDSPGYCSMNKFDSLSADKIISKYPYTRLKQPSGEKKTKSKHEVKYLLSNLVDIPKNTDDLPTSFPFTSEINCFEKEWRTLHMFKETQEIDFTFLKQDFSSHSVSFNPSQYNLENEELSYLLMTSLYSPETAVNIGHHYGQPYTSYHEIIRTTSKYWFLKTDWKCDSSDWLNKVPASFKWLMNFISRYSYINCSVLYRVVIQIEKLLFLQKKKILTHKLSDFKNKINVNF